MTWIALSASFGLYDQKQDIIDVIMIHYVYNTCLWRCCAAWMICGCQVSMNGLGIQNPKKMRLRRLQVQSFFHLPKTSQKCLIPGPWSLSRDGGGDACDGGAGSCPGFTGQSKGIYTQNNVSIYSMFPMQILFIYIIPTWLSVKKGYLKTLLVTGKKREGVLFDPSPCQLSAAVGR